MTPHRALVGMILATTLVSILGCTAREGPADRVDFRSPGIDRALEAGLAITPLLADSKVADSDEATALITN